MRFSSDLRAALIGALTVTAAILCMSSAERFTGVMWSASIGIAAIGVMALGLAAARWRRLSVIDDATGLYNRRYLFARLRAELGRARRTGAPISFVVAEVDNMREHNNLHGHLAGDAVLLAVAQALRAGVRRGDIVGRWGGDEFGLILRGADADEALRVVERIRAAIAELGVPTGTGQLLRPTISAGVAASASRGQPMLELMDRADKAMYAAKAEGKNRVVPAV